MTQYALVGAKGYRIEITSEDFEHLKLARNCLFNALAIEDKFNLLLENYVEFEQEVLNRAAHNMVFEFDDWSLSIDQIHTVNRRVINLLTTCRLYEDQVIHNIHLIYGAGSAQAKAVKSQMSQEYDSTRPGYRVMAALRNYVQHRDLPSLTLTTTMSRIEHGSNMFVKNTIGLSVNVEALSESGGFKSEVLTELQSLGESFNLTFFIRQCLESFGRIHLKTREILSSDLSGCDELLQHSINQYQQATGQEVGLRAGVVSESTLTEGFWIFEDLVTRRKRLEGKNRNLTHYSFHFISSEAP
ncbi:MAG TPA: hypothetical protein V6C84_07750 [Coleofasciculaceae cyanobacterium]